MEHNCKICNKEFGSKQALGAHSIAHLKRIRYNKIGRTNKDLRECEECKSFTKNNKFCSTSCSALNKKKITETKILNNKLVGHGQIKDYLLSLDARCVFCKISNVWNGIYLVLHLDHIDGNSDNSILSNVRLLCPNCHSQTETYCSRKLTNSNSKRSIRLRSAPSRKRKN